MAFFVKMHVLEVQVSHEAAIFYFDALHFDTWGDEHLSRLVMLCLLDALCVEGANVEWSARDIPTQEAGSSILIFLRWVSPGIDSAALAKDERVVFISDDLNGKLLVCAIAFREGALLCRVPDGEGKDHDWPLDCPRLSLSLGQLFLRRRREADLSLGVAAPGVDFAAVSQRKAVAAPDLNRDDELLVW